MTELPITPYEQRLISEMEEIDLRIKELLQEKSVLQRLLIKARWERDVLFDVTRKNSANRIMIERRIIDFLKKEKSASVSHLYKESLKINYNLKYNSFRTYINRMKQKGLIESSGWGRWRIADNYYEE